MIIKLSKIISCSSEHPLYPCSNLLEHPPKSSWRCSKPNELMATVIFQLAEPSCITGIEIGNYRSCFVAIEASTFAEPDKWIPITNHQFLSHDEVANSKFRDQIQLFTKRELNSETIKIKFDRVKLTCMQSANPREIFGLEFIILKTDVIVDLGLDIFGRFKLKEQNDDKINEFKDKYLKLFQSKREDTNCLKKKNISSIIKPIFQIEESVKSVDTMKNQKVRIKNQVIVPSTQTLFEDIISNYKNKFSNNCKINNDTNINYENIHDKLQSCFSNEKNIKNDCFLCISKSDNLCKVCNLLLISSVLVKKRKKSQIKIDKSKKEFCKLFDDISFSLSGYVNPRRNEIRRKALKMGAKYIADPNLTNNKCTHLICCFKNTPKYKQLKGHCKIVNHNFIEDCFNKKKRISWRQYALNNKDQNKSEIEESISPIPTLINYEQSTDDSDY